MKRFFFFFVFFSALLLSSSAFSSSAAENYRFYCSQCHGLIGKGDGINATKSQPVKPRDHTDKGQMGRLSDADIINVIGSGGRAAGKSTMMPPFSGTLAKEEIIELKDYLRSLCECAGP